MGREPKLVLGVEVERHQPNDEEEIPLGNLRFDVFRQELVDHYLELGIIVARTDNQGEQLVSSVGTISPDRNGAP